MNKQKKISPHSTASRPILSRGTRMRMLSKSTQMSGFGSLSTNVPVNITNITFEGQDLTDEFFKKGDNYTNANFKDTAIYNQIFEEVILDGADFTNTKNNTYPTKPFVSFRNASLIKAIFIDASLENAIFNGANLTGVDFTGANLRGVNFTGANLRGVNFTVSNLSDAKFLRVTILEYANFTGATLINVDFTGTKKVFLNNFTDAIFSPPFNTSEWAKCNSYAFQCRNIDTVSDADLKAKITENPTRYCNEVMGRSCGDKGNKISTFDRWKTQGGECPPDSKIKGSDYDSNCTTGCNKTKTDCFFCGKECQ